MRGAYGIVWLTRCRWGGRGGGVGYFGLVLRENGYEVSGELRRIENIDVQMKVAFISWKNQGGVCLRRTAQR